MDTDYDLNYDEASNVMKRKELVGTDPRNDTWDYVYGAGSRMTSATGKDPTKTTEVLNGGRARSFVYSVGVTGHTRYC